MINSTISGDYIDQLSYILPTHRTFTDLERLLIVFLVSVFVSIVGCTLLCLLCPRSPLRRRYYPKNKLNTERHSSVNTISRKSILVDPPPPRYESIVRADEIADFNKVAASPYLHLPRKFSNGTVSDSDGAHSSAGSDYPPLINGKHLSSQSARSSLSQGGVLSGISNTYPLPPYAQMNVKLEIDLLKNLLNVNLTDGEHFPIHPGFGEQAEYVIRIQLINNKILKKFSDGWKKRRSSLTLNTWKKQLEKNTKNLFRTPNDTLICDEHIQFPTNKIDLAITSLRFLLFSTDRSGMQDLMLESLIPMSLSMIPKHEQTIEFNNIPQINFGEVFLGISYLPTSERFTININKLRYFFKSEKENKIDARLTATLLHNGRRFFQKKIPFTLHGSTSVDNEIKDVITQNVPQHDIQSVHVHLELTSKDNALLSSSSVLLGEYTRYESDWQKMIEHPRQSHLGWYQFLG